ncbi:MAG: enoyl-CoA hydratase-related protein, partial [Nitriliruptoraceae bacterium]
MVSELFDAERWRPVDGFADLTDVTYHRAVDPSTGGDLPTVRVAFDRPAVRNAFRPHTVDELLRALEHARTTSDVGCVLLTGNGPSPSRGEGHDVAEQYVSTEKQRITIPFSLFTKDDFVRDILTPLMVLTSLSYPKRVEDKDSEVGAGAEVIAGGVRSAATAAAELLG